MGRSNRAFLPSRHSTYAVRGPHAADYRAVPVNESLLSHYDRPLRPSLQVGLTVCDLMSLEYSFRAQLESLSYAMWVLSGLLGFIRIQGFSPSDPALFNQLVTALSKSLAHQAHVAASHTAYACHKRREFYLSHLPAYFTDSTKRSLLSAPSVFADSLFREEDVAQLLDWTCLSSSLRSQQAMVDMVSRHSSSSARAHRPSPRRLALPYAAAVNPPALLPASTSGFVLIRRPLLLFEIASQVPFSGLGVMSLAAQGRGLFVLLVGGLGILGRGALGRPGPQGELLPAFPLQASFVINTGPPSELLPIVCEGVSSHCSGSRLTVQRCYRISVLGAWLLQPLLCNTEGHGWLAASHRSFSPQLLCPTISISYGDGSVCPPISSPGDWMISLDLQDAYLQVPVHPDSRRYLRFCIGPRTFQFRALCFGLSSAPQVFTRVMAPISSLMYRQGFRILRYLDDWLVLGSSREEIVRAGDFLLSLCDQLGVLVNLDKSSLNPSQTIDYLGMSLHTSLRAFPIQTRIQKVLSLVSEFTSSPAPPLPLWRSLLGVMSSLTPLIPGARLRMRSLQLRLRIAGPQQSDSALISWDDSCHQDLLWWSEASHLVGGVSLELPHPRLLLFTDVSDTGWGATLGADHLSGMWTQDISCYSINHRELLAVLYALPGFLHLLRGQSVSLFTDNTSALTYLRKQGGTRSATLNSVAQSILHLCEANDVHLLPQFVPRKLNVIADSLSRDSQVLGSEWTICQEVCRDLFCRWPVIIYLFTTSMNHRLPVYFSLVVDPQALATEARSQSWDSLQAYAFPPFGFIPNVLAKISQSWNLEATLVAPYWPLKPWFPDILELLVDVPVLLPFHKDLLLQPHFHHFHRNLPTLHTTGFRKASEQREVSASLRQWRASLPSAAGLPPV